MTLTDEQIFVISIGVIAMTVAVVAVLGVSA